MLFHKRAGSFDLFPALRGAAFKRLAVPPDQERRQEQQVFLFAEPRGTGRPCAPIPRGFLLSSDGLEPRDRVLLADRAARVLVADVLRLRRLTVVLRRILLEVKALGAVKTSVYIYMVPVITMAASAAVLHEKITALTAAGAILTLAGLFLSESKLFLRKGAREDGPEKRKMRDDP